MCMMMMKTSRLKPTSARIDRRCFPHHLLLLLLRPDRLNTWFETYASSCIRPTGHAAFTSPTTESNLWYRAYGFGFDGHVLDGAFTSGLALGRMKLRGRPFSMHDLRLCRAVGGCCLLWALVFIAGSSAFITTALTTTFGFRLYILPQSISRGILINPFWSIRSSVSLSLCPTCPDSRRRGNATLSDGLERRAACADSPVWCAHPLPGYNVFYIALCLRT